MATVKMVLCSATVALGLGLVGDGIVAGLTLCVFGVLAMGQHLAVADRGGK